MDYKRINEFRLLGLTIAYYRKLRGLTQAELAEATNLSRTHRQQTSAVHISAILRHQMEKHQFL